LSVLSKDLNGEYLVPQQFSESVSEHCVVVCPTTSADPAEEDRRVVRLFLLMAET
jgi:hypothetical protein